MPKTLISREGLDKLISELKLLKTIKRPAVIERIQTARSLGDLSENSEYDDARNEQSFIEGRIEQLEGLIKNAKVVENGVNEVVITGSTIELDLNGSEKTYQIVS
ncbi:MAG: transcription elongation factor GreA, partial [Candidatus Berkelbacteria bacterium Licking1014_85]